ncbi:tRNA uridine(34) 5-carboxymethylaminomethyl modification radical SAM/GNAT enzyme Elp3 [Candidatus Pacearchaeota archaeon]|nr:tRNA uridine(34) 5-carboxymethylaminomethyl modification radical SAM/GNAT enzyme Elp3 [Candidatus Pacearchaeota archaeon]
MLKPKHGEIRKPTKTLSGITPVAVMLPPRGCKHGECTYCPNLDVPQSYTPKSPVVLRAREVKYSAYKQTVARLHAFEVMNHPTEKIEIIIMGGTFTEYPTKFQNNFIKGIYDALNGKISKTLKLAQKKNEKAKHRCVALCVETRPDRVEYNDIKKMREWGATRVELGVQIIDNKIYKKIKRGHMVKDVIDATKRLKDAGFKVGYHIMPGLPGATPKHDIELFKKLFTDENFKPDQLKIYPCQVMPGSKLEDDYYKKKYKPYTKTQIQKILTQMMKLVPRYCRVMRVMREIPPEFLVAGTIRIDLRREVEKELREKNIKLEEIRYREIGFALQLNPKINKKLKLKITKYRASNGDEYFLEIVNENDILFGLLRLRITKDKAIIREIHVYGQALKLGIKGKLGQHAGFGKSLMLQAEKITKDSGHKKLSVISGVGVREYYRKLGYKLRDTYMVKRI